jgi:malate/lactate dehydrogenase
MGLNPKDVDVTVIGGHAGITILPLYSAVPGLKLSETEMSAITVRTREFNTENIYCLILSPYCHFHRVSNFSVPFIVK